MGLRARRLMMGTLALCLFGGAVGLTGVFLDGGFQGGVPVRAFFGAPGVGQQLPVGGDVKIRGVLVGRIAGVSYEDGAAVVELRLDRDVDVPADVRAEIRSKTIFGQKWVELIPADGAAAEPTLAQTGVIADEATREPLELERALQRGHDLLSEVPLRDLATVFSELADGFEGQEQAAGMAIDDGLVALKSVNSRADEFDTALRQLHDFSTWLDENDSVLLSFMSSLDSANRALVGAAPEYRSNLGSVPVFFNDLASFQEATEESLGRLVQDGAGVAEILARRKEDLRALIVNLQPFTTVWNSGLSQPCESLYESDLTCWQVYQAPGMESRGLYGPGEAPEENEPGDPNFTSGRRSTRLFDRLVARYRQGDLSDTARILLQPLFGNLLPEERAR